MTRDRLPRCCRHIGEWWFDCPKHATRVRGHHGSASGGGCGSYDLRLVRDARSPRRRTRRQLRRAPKIVMCGTCGAGPLEPVAQ